MRILVINPNINELTTQRIRKVADTLVSMPNQAKVVSANSGIELIKNVNQEKVAAKAVVSLIKLNHLDFNAIVIAAFSDPGLLDARKISVCPVFGICESAMEFASQTANRFSIISVGQSLKESIRINVEKYNYNNKVARIRMLPWSKVDEFTDPIALQKAFVKECELAIFEDAAEAIIIGGGPLSGLADTISDQLTVPIFDGVKCAIKLALKSSYKAQSNEK